ncbi:MAG: hypothetical protein KDE03_04935 [Rhodobacteraceae bacterium]|nr:hypothetical protein [Paracoccaceae bacterium]
MSGHLHDHGSDAHDHGDNCGVPHPLFGLGVAAAIVALVALALMVAM